MARDERDIPPFQVFLVEHRVVVYRFLLRAVGPDDADVARIALGSVDPLWENVAGLPPRQRVALVHRVVLDRSYAETAQAMGSTEETARANVYQALKKLRIEVRDE